MKAGAALSLMVRLRVPPAGRMGGIVRCGCNLSLAARMAYSMYVGGRMAKRAPPGARLRAARFLPSDRPHLVPLFSALSSGPSLCFLSGHRIVNGFDYRQD